MGRGERPRSTLFWDVGSEPTSKSEDQNRVAFPPSADEKCFVLRATRSCLVKKKAFGDQSVSADPSTRGKAGGRDRRDQQR